MNILALDFGTKLTGWAHSNNASGVWDLRRKTDESEGLCLLVLQHTNKFRLTAPEETLVNSSAYLFITLSTPELEL